MIAIAILSKIIATVIIVYGVCTVVMNGYLVKPFANPTEEVEGKEMFGIILSLVSSITVGACLIGIAWLL